jgi:parallel beta-helix repeat protein
MKRAAFAAMLIGAVLGIALIMRIIGPGERTPRMAPSPDSIDSNAIRLKVGDNFQQIVSGSPPGTHFVIASGIHRLQQVKPKDGQVFTGEPGAVMSGAKVLNDFIRDGGLWVARGQTQQGPTHPAAAIGHHQLPGHERENHPEDVFFDEMRLRHVASISQLGSGEWFFDYAADKIYLFDDPTGHRIETSAATHAFSAPGVEDVVIENLTVRHYANTSQTGAVHAAGTRDWTIRYVEASYNHAIGIHTGPGTYLHHSQMLHNGQMGLRGIGDNMRIEHNEIAFNRELGYNWLWEAGAMKILESTGTMFRHNWVHDNAGPGIWFDAFNRSTTIESNLVERNTHIGIFYEISYGPTKIRWNIVRDNGAGQPGAGGAGILISNSREVDVVENAVDNNQNGIMLTMVNREAGPDGMLETANVRVIGNDIRMLSGGTGLVDETGNDAYYTSKGNVFEENTYYLENPGALRFVWTERWTSAITWESWRAEGNDQSGYLADPMQEFGTPERFEDPSGHSGPS